jgi:DNA-nicking Smr family endonuclease
MADQSDDDDKKLFRAAVRDVKPLRKTPKVTPPPPRPTYRRRKPESYDEPTPIPLSDYERLEPVSSEDLLEYKKTGLQHKVLRKMRSGQYNVEAVLDLHGMTAEEAKEAIFGFILHCQQEDACHVLIIHGKGRSNSNHPILKNKLNHWLRQLDAVLAFCSAKAKDGKSGALYVLLKHQT